MTREEFNKLNMDDQIIIGGIDHRVTGLNTDQDLIELGVVQLNEFSRMTYISKSWYRYENIELVNTKTEPEVPKNFIQFFG